MKNHSRNLHAPLCGIFHPNSVVVARYDALIRAKSPTNCDTHLAESLFQTRSKAVKSSIGIIIHLKYILSFRFAQRNDLIVPNKKTDCAGYLRETVLANLYCSRRRTIMYSMEVRNGLYDTKRGRRKMGRDIS